MRKLTSRIINKLRISLGRITFEGLGLTIILIVLLLVIITSTLRVIQNGQHNYNIYKTEQESLKNLRSENQRLEEEYTIVSSDEYQKLLARDVLGVVEQNESLYRVNEQGEFYYLEKRYIDLKEKEGYMDWWFSLIR